MEFVAKLFPTSCNAMFRWLAVSRTLEVSYLTNLALLPWSKFPPFPWLHENAQWSDPVFAFTAVLWAVQCRKENRWPRAEGAHLAIAAYAGAATHSFFFAAGHHPAGALKLLGLAELLMLAGPLQTWHAGPISRARWPGLWRSLAPRGDLCGREKKCIAGFQPAKVVLTQKELSRLRCRRDAGATFFLTTCVSAVRFGVRALACSVQCSLKAELQTCHQ
ncbi:MAG: hypothetical protein DMG09_02095 [Acidobacteria bacterium]|nr:MAG: hypothetical protein DMG09_02095 [Acidobacteriota bacterium]